jgi:hypothetical protein
MLDRSCQRGALSTTTVRKGVKFGCDGSFV